MRYQINSAPASKPGDQRRRHDHAGQAEGRHRDVDHAQLARRLSPEQIWTIVTVGCVGRCTVLMHSHLDA